MIIDLLVVDRGVFDFIKCPLTKVRGAEIILFTNKHGNWHILNFSQIDWWWSFLAVLFLVLLISVVKLQEIVSSARLEVMQKLLWRSWAATSCSLSLNNISIVKMCFWWLRPGVDQATWDCKTKHVAYHIPVRPHNFMNGKHAKSVL